MAKEETTKGMGGNGKLKQEYINIVEKRLSFSGGTLLVEIGAAIAEKYGKGKPMMREHKRFLEHNRAIREQDQIQMQARRSNGPPTTITVAEARNLIKEKKFDVSFTLLDMKVLEELKVEAKMQFQKERAEFSEAAKAYVIDHYGAAIQDQYGKLKNYGERVEVLENAHLRKFW